MHCPYCGGRQSEVVETRDNEDLDAIRRRRSCLKCDKRFTTYERVEHVNLMVLKKDGKREQFDRQKLTNGLVRACEKTTVSREMLEKVVTEIIQELRLAETTEVPSKEIGDLIARRLKTLDQVAYIRFASVFKHFVAVEDFEREVQDLHGRRVE
jgi:transcriptional repressor NrdR